MASTQMLFLIEPNEFWQQMKTLIEEIVEWKINNKPTSIFPGKLTDKALLKMTEICELFQVMKPTIYEWIKQGKLKSIKIQLRRYFLIGEVECLIKHLPNA